MHILPQVYFYLVHWVVGRAQKVGLLSADAIAPYCKPPFPLNGVDMYLVQLETLDRPLHTRLVQSVLGQPTRWESQIRQIWLWHACVTIQSGCTTPHTLKSKANHCNPIHSSNYLTGYLQSWSSRTPCKKRPKFHDYICRVPTDFPSKNCRIIGRFCKKL